MSCPSISLLVGERRTFLGRHHLLLVDRVAPTMDEWGSVPADRRSVAWDYVVSIGAIVGPPALFLMTLGVSCTSRYPQAITSGACSLGPCPPHACVWWFCNRSGQEQRDRAGAGRGKG